MELLSRSRRWALAAFAASLALSPVGSAAPVREYAVKAAFLFQFTRFVEWPADAFSSPRSPFRLCVVGDDPFEGALAAIVAGEAAGGRRLVAEHHPEPGSTGECQVVFLAAGNDPETLDGLPDAGSARRLVVVESERALGRGGHFRFRLAEGRVRLSVNLAALERSRLRVSSKLLRLAEVEIGGSG